MVATVGSISIDLSTNAAKFATGFKSAASTVEQQSALMARSVSAVEKSVNSVGTTLKNFGAGIAAGAGLAAIASLGGAFDKLKETISEYDKIASDAKTTGLKTDTFQALAFAAKQANIEYDSFNSSLDIFAKNSGLAVKGQGALYSGLKNLNPQLLQAILNTKDQEERLKLVADAMSKTTDATKQAALATVVFGKGGIEMARILEQGRASIEKFKATARDLGIIVPDDLLQRAGELDDKLDVLAKVIDVQLGEALIKLAPLLVGATEKFAEFSTGLNETSGALDTFVNNPNWANFNKLLVAMGSQPIVKGSVLDTLANGKSQDTGILGGMVDNYAKAFEEFGKIFTNATTNTSDEQTAAIAANIRYLEDLIAQLKKDAEGGMTPELQIETDQATAKLKALQKELGVTQAAGVTAANTISGQFAQAFREAENASMDALAKMNAGLAAAATSAPLPTVTRYGGDPNKITLPGESQFGVTKSSSGTLPDSYQPNANGSGVGVRSYGGTDPNLKATADYTGNTSKYTRQTSDNVSKLDSNTKRYLESLSSDIGGYSQQQNIVINKLSDVTAQTFGMLSHELLAALVLKNDTADGSIANNGFLTHDQVFIPGMGQTGRPIGTLHLSPRTSDGTSNTSVNVQQPGTSITLNYQAAANESEQTARQRARDMYNEMLLQAARA